MSVALLSFVAKALTPDWNGMAWHDSGSLHAHQLAPNWERIKGMMSVAPPLSHICTNTFAQGCEYPAYRSIQKFCYNL